MNIKTAMACIEVHWLINNIETWGQSWDFKEVTVEETVKNLSAAPRLNSLRHLGAFPQKLLIKLNLRIFRPNSFLATELFSI